MCLSRSIAAPTCPTNRSTAVLIGKTALLEYLVRSSSDVTVVRAVGVESDMELAFASLHQLCASLLDRLATT